MFRGEYYLSVAWQFKIVADMDPCPLLAKGNFASFSLLYRSILGGCLLPPLFYDGGPVVFA